MEKDSRIIDLNRYLPDLSDTEINFYLDEFYQLDRDEFINKVVSIQRIKNKKFLPIGKLEELLVQDEDFENLYSIKDELIKICPEFFTNENIKNFLTNHTINLSGVFETKKDEKRSIVGSVKVLPQTFSNEDIAYNPEGVYFKDCFFYLHPTICDLHEFRLTFLGMYSKYREKSCVFQISINLRKVVLVENYKRVELEKGYHYGPMGFDESVFMNKNKALFTRHYADHNTPLAKSNKIVYTDFFIDTKNGELQIEEVSLRSNGEGKYINRFTHCIFDKNKKKISHFDGSILFYDEKGISQRKDTTLEKKPKLAYQKTKLFRMDGEMNIADRKQMTYKFFLGNEMILEYFEANVHQEQGDDSSFGEKRKKNEKELILRIKKFPSKYEIKNDFHTIVPESEDYL